MLEWIVMGGLAVALYVVIYKYEKRIEQLEQRIDANKENINANKEKLDEHYNHIENLWVNVPVTKTKKGEEE